MKTITLKARSDENGVVRLEVPTDICEKDLEIVLVLQTIDDEPVDDMGYPVGYFDETYGSLADDPIERNQPLYPDERDPIE